MRSMVVFEKTDRDVSGKIRPIINLPFIARRSEVYYGSYTPYRDHRWRMLGRPHRGAAFAEGQRAYKADRYRQDE